jgi:hypothetical protein
MSGLRRLQINTQAVLGGVRRVEFVDAAGRVIAEGRGYRDGAFSGVSIEKGVVERMRLLSFEGDECGTAELDPTYLDVNDVITLEIRLS